MAIEEIEADLGAILLKFIGKPINEETEKEIAGAVSEHFSGLRTSAIEVERVGHNGLEVRFLSSSQGIVVARIDGCKLH